MTLTPIPILLYHHVDAQQAGSYNTAPELFEAHMAWLADNGYRSLSLSELQQRIAGESVSKGLKEVLISFDDGYECLQSHAAPILSKHGLRAAAFVITSKVDTAGYLSWQQAATLADQEIFEFHSHTHTHNKQWPLNNDSTETITAELLTSRRLLAQHLRQPDSQFSHLAWPFGRTCSAWDQAAADAGFDGQYVVQRGAVTQLGQFDRLPRLLADGISLNSLKFWMYLLSKPSTANMTNRLFGTYRQIRHGGAYMPITESLPMLNKVLRN